MAQLAPGSLYRPIIGGYTIPRASALFQFLDSTSLTPVTPLMTLGDAEVELDVKNTDTDIFAADDPSGGLVDSLTARTVSTLKVKIKQFTAFSSPLIYMAQPGKVFTQTGATGTMTVMGVVPGQVIEIVDQLGNRVYNLTSAVVTDDTAGSPVPYTQDSVTSETLGNCNVTAGGAPGTVELRTIPANASPNVKIAWTSTGITAAMARQSMALMSQNDFRGRMLLVQNNGQGKSRLFTLPLVKLSVTQSPKISQEGTEIASADLEGKILRNPNINPLFARGSILDLN